MRSVGWRLDIGRFDSRTVAVGRPLAACAIIASLHWLFQGRAGLNLWDEGFLWYGMLAVLSGEIPIRDFMAYDPGRYYILAAFQWLLGSEGVLPSRVGTLLIVAVAGGFALHAALHDREGRVWQVGFPSLLVAALILGLWVFPRHKGIDIACSLALFAAVAHCLNRPSPHRFLALGLLVGVVATIGRNHGLYGAIASVATWLWLAMGSSDWRDQATSSAMHWVLGVFLGYLPLISMLVAIPGFASAFLESLLFYLELGGTNIALPTPWPWRAEYGGDLAGYMGSIAVGIGFVLQAAVAACALGLLATKATVAREWVVPPWLASGLFVGAPYAHFSFSRADTAHLAQGAFPLLMLFIGFALRLHMRWRWPVLLALVAVSMVVALPIQHGFVKRMNGDWVEIEVSGERLTVPPWSAAEVSGIQKLGQEHLSEGQVAVFMPYWPGAYAVLGVKAPVWEIFALVPRSEEFQRAEIDRLAGADIGFALVSDTLLDGKPERNFGATHPILYDYLRNRLQVKGWSGLAGQQLMLPVDDTSVGDES